MNPSDIKVGDHLAVDVPDVLPDPTDPAFGCLRDGIVKVRAIGEGWFEYEVIRGTAYQVGASGSIPFKYADYLRPDTSASDEANV